MNPKLQNKDDVAAAHDDDADDEHDTSANKDDDGKTRRSYHGHTTGFICGNTRACMLHLALPATSPLKKQFVFLSTWKKY